MSDCSSIPTVELALRRIDGVGSIQIWGVRSKLTLPSGYVSESGKKIYIRSVGHFQSVDEIAEIVVDRKHRLQLYNIIEVPYRVTPKGLNRPYGWQGVAELRHLRLQLLMSR